MIGWKVVVTGPEGQTDEGGIDIWGDVEMSPESLAESMADIVWRIVMDMARGIETISEYKPLSSQEYELAHGEDAFGNPTNPVDQINEALGWDADVSDPKQYCRHGTFIGSWAGPDYLCGACEMGE